MSAARIFLFAGQSNMVGSGAVSELPAALLKPPAGTHLYEDGALHDSLLWRAHFGPELGFAHALATSSASAPTILCKVAASGANLAYDWAPDATARSHEDTYRGPLYPRLVDHIGQLTRLCSPARIEGMLWMQGERDSVFSSMAESYERNLTAFIEAIRRDSGVRDLPFVLGLIAPRVYRIAEGVFQHAHRDVVRAAQLRVAAALPCVMTVETNDLPQRDNLHYDTGGQVELGRRFAKGYRSLCSPSD